MSAIKERIVGAVTVMSEEDAVKVWDIIRFQFSVPSDMPSEDEENIIRAYKQGVDDYIPYLTHNDLKKDLGLE